MATGAGTRDKRHSDAGPRARGILVFGVLMSLMFLAVAARLVQLQVMEHEPRALEAANQLWGTVHEREHRGAIVDSRGITMAASVAVKACALDPKVLLEAKGAKPEKLIGRLTEMLALTPAEVEKLNKGLEKRYVPANSADGVEQPLRFVWVKRRMTDEQWLALSTEISKAQRQASDAWRYRRRWLRLAGQKKVARDFAAEQKCREAAEGWRRVALDAEGRYAGVFFPPEYERVYPQGGLAAHILGFGDIDGRGLEGVEKTCESLLKGEGITRMVAWDARSRALSTMATDERSTTGMTVELTIDSVVQAIVEEELQQAVDKYKAEFPDIHAHAVVMDPFTGDILAIANYPTFDPNHPGIDRNGRRVDPRNRRNDAVAAVQEPGSTFKPLLIAASIEEKLAKFDETVECSAFRMENGRTIKDIYPYGRMSLEMAVVKSSNPAMVRVGQRLGPAKMREYVLKYGFGEKSESRLPGEVRGRVTAADKWSSYTMGSVPMGYEINVTTLQMAAAYSVFANGGLLPRPNVVRAVYDASGGLAMKTEPEMRRRVVSEDTAAKVRKVLRKVVTDGTGRRANISEYQLGGKSGTANMIVNEKERAAGMRGYSKKRHTANFVALAPWDKPRAVICVSIRDTGKFGGEASSPVVAGIARRVLGYWGVPTADGSAIKADILPAVRVEQPRAAPIHVMGAPDDENYMEEEIDPRWFEDLVDEEDALG